jgi:hypothetical protein
MGIERCRFSRSGLSRSGESWSFSVLPFQGWSVFLLLFQSVRRRGFVFRISRARRGCVWQATPEQMNRLELQSLAM